MLEGVDVGTLGMKTMKLLPMMDYDGVDVILKYLWTVHCPLLIILDFRTSSGGGGT